MFTKKVLFCILATSGFCTLFNLVHAAEVIRNPTIMPASTSFNTIDVPLITPTMHASAFIKSLTSNIFTNEYMSIKLDPNTAIPSNSSSVLSADFNCLVFSKNNTIGEPLDKSVIHIERISNTQNRRTAGNRFWGKQLNTFYETPISIRLTMQIPIFSITNLEGDKQTIIATKQLLPAIAAETSSPANPITVDDYKFEGVATVYVKLSISAPKEISVYKKQPRNVNTLFNLTNVKFAPSKTNTAFKIYKGHLGLEEGSCQAEATIAVLAPDNNLAESVMVLLEEGVTAALKSIVMGV